MKEIMYDQNSIVIVALLFFTLVMAIEVGYRLGRVYVSTTTDSTKAQVNTIQAALLGILALLLGFTFSLALQRYDSRSQAVILEANAIGTTVLRAGLLPESVRTDTQHMLKKYLDLRVQSGAVSLDQVEKRGAVLSESKRVLDSLWRLALRAANENPSPVTSGLYIQALNDMIDAYGTRDAALSRHVPEPVLFLMFGAFILAACLVGFASGVAAHRAAFPTYVLIVLIVFMVFMIIDLDRPRRGIIEISQQSLLDLQSELQLKRVSEN